MAKEKAELARALKGAKSVSQRAIQALEANHIFQLDGWTVYRGEGTRGVLAVAPKGNPAPSIGGVGIAGPIQDLTVQQFLDLCAAASDEEVVAIASLTNPDMRLIGPWVDQGTRRR
jgi:hypothetical protein